MVLPSFSRLPGPSSQSQAESWNLYGTPNKEWSVLAEHKEGSVLEIKAVMSAYHWVSVIEFPITSEQMTYGYV